MTEEALLLTVKELQDVNRHLHAQVAEKQRIINTLVVEHRAEIKRLKAELERCRAGTQ